jgi:hypothetical protein
MGKGFRCWGTGFGVYVTVASRTGRIVTAGTFRRVIIKRERELRVPRGIGMARHGGEEGVVSPSPRFPVPLTSRV